MKKSILAILVVLLLVGLFAFSAFGEETTVTFAPYTDADGVRQYCACGNAFVADENGTVKYVNGEDGCKNHKDESGNILAGCDGTLLSWKPWSKATALPRYQSESVKDEESGLYYCYYYLTSTVNLSGQMSINSLVNVYLDLNGQTVNGASGARVYSVHYDGAGLTLTDTVGTGSINTVGTKADRGMVLWARNNSYTRLCGITMYGGTLNASTVTNATNGAGVRVDASQSFTMFGGKIIGGVATTNGGSLYVASGGTATIYDGTITEGTAASGGGNICVAGTIEIYNANVSNGRATNGGGGNVLVGATGTATISGGTFSYGNSSAQGGNLRVDSGGTLTINGGTFQYGGMDPETKEVTTTQGGNLVVLSDNVSITAGHFIGGQAQTYGGNIRTGKALTLGKGVILEGGKSDCGGNLTNASGGTITIDGATIRDGEAATSGGNIYNAENKTLNIVSATISGGTAVSGGSIASVSTLNISGGTISGGSASANGGNIHSTAAMTISGGTVNDGSGNNGGNIYSTGGFAMTGGQVSGGTASNNGGNIWTNDLTLSGGSIYDGTCTENRAYDTTNKVYTDNVNTGVGGNLYLGGDAQFAMTGGDIYNGVINGNNGGNIFVFGNSSGESVVSITAGRIWGGNVNADGSKASTAALKSLDDVMGGSIYYYKEGTYSIGGTATIGLDANGNEAGGHSHHGGNITVYLGTLTISDDVIITGGDADGEGGNLQCYSGAAINMTSGTVRNGQANNGGNVLNGGTFNMSGGKIIDGTAANRGGNIQSFRGNSGTFTMSDDAEVSSGTAGKYGGNFFLGGVNSDTRYGTLVMNGGTVSGGTASGTYGGNIAVNNMGKLVLNDGTISGGTAKTNGGNIYVGSVYAVCQLNGGTISGGAAELGGNLFTIATVPAENMTVGAVTIQNGTAGGNGGNCYVQNICTFNGTTLTGGEAVNGGGIYTNGELTLTGCTVSGAEASAEGGAVYVETGSLTVTDSTMACNAKKGGNLHIETGTVICTSCQLTGGTAANAVYGYIAGGSLTMTDCTMIGGSATGNGGGFFVNGDAALSINGGSITNVSSGLNGGAIFSFVDAATELTNVTISGASAAEKGGSIFTAGTMTITGGSMTGGNGALGGNMYTKGTTTLSGVTLDAGVATGGITVAEDGTVSGGDKTYGGGNIYVEQGELNIQDGTTISGGVTHFSNGGNIYMDEGTVNMTGGTISGGDAITYNENTSGDYKCGGNLALTNVCTFNMTGGTITGGTANEGGNIRVGHTSVLNISGDALIEKGSAKNGGNINTYGTVVMNGGTVTGGNAAGNGGNVQAHRSNVSGYVGVFTLNGGVISNGNADTRGGNVYCAGYKEKVGHFVMNGGQIIGGTSATGGNVYIQNLGSATINGGTITGGTATTANGVYLAGNATEIGGELILAGDPTIESLYISNVNNFTVDASDLACTNVIPVTVPQLGVFADSAVDTSAYFSCEAEYEVYYDAAAQKLYVRYPVVQDVYVSASGDDYAAGNEANPVQTFARALNIVADGGTIHLVGAVEVSGWTAHGKSITITGDEMNVTKGNPFFIRDSVHFTNMTMRFSTVTADTNDTAGKHRIYCLGNKVVIDQNVTVKYGADGSGVTGQYVYLFGGGNDSNVVDSTDLTVLSGTWGRIFGGSNGSDISGDVHLTVGGNVNQGVDYVSHDYASYYLIHGGSSGGDIGGTVYMNVTGGTHSSTHGGSIGECTIGNIEMHVTGGEGMAIYGGGRTGLNQVTGEANIYIEGGYYEQVFGGGLNAFEGNINLFITGGEVSRRVYGGCYNEWLLSYKTSYQVNGTVNLYIGENANLSLNYDSDRALFAHSRYSVSYSDNETNRIIFLNQAAYEKYGSKIGDVSGSVLGSSTRAADYICYLGWSASGNVIKAGATQVEDHVSDALDLASATATVNVEQEAYEYRGEAVTPATVTYSDNWTHGNVALTYANNNAAGTATATITANGVSANKTFQIVDNSVTVVINGETKTYYNLQDAFDAAGEGGLVQLTANCAQNVTVNTNLYLDLNGKNINGTVTVADGVTFYGMDSTTDDYDCSGGYGKISSIEGSYFAKEKITVNDRILRYLDVVEEDGISFHRYYLGIQKVTLKPGTVGLGYKAIFGGDEKVKAKLSETNAFGYGLWIEGSENAKQTRYKNGADFAIGSEGNVLTLGLNNVMSTEYTEEMNKANSEIVIYAEVYMVIDGEIITSATYSYTLKELVQDVDTALNDNAANYSENKITAVKKLYETYATVMEGWDLKYINQQ